MIKEVKETIMTISHQVANINKELDILKKKVSNGNSGVENYN